MDWSDCPYVEVIAYSFDLDPQDIIAVLSYANQRLAVKSAG